MTVLACYVNCCVKDLFVQCLWTVADQMLRYLPPVAAVLINIALHCEELKLLSICACRASHAKINRTLEDVGLILQYQDHMLDRDDTDSDQDPHDSPPDWESGWADNLLLSRNSTGSGLLESDTSTHCGVLSAAASAVGAASHSSAGFQSDDEAPSLSGTSNSIQGLLRNESAQGRSRGHADYPPFTHPTYIAHIQQASTKLATICRLLDLAALAEEVRIQKLAVCHAQRSVCTDVAGSVQRVWWLATYVSWHSILVRRQECVS